jgi:hypothetical protein
VPEEEAKDDLGEEPGEDDEWGPIHYIGPGEWVLPPFGNDPYRTYRATPRQAEQAVARGLYAYGWAPLSPEEAERLERQQEQLRKWREERTSWAVDDTPRKRLDEIGRGLRGLEGQGLDPSHIAEWRARISDWLAEERRCYIEAGDKKGLRQLDRNPVPTVLSLNTWRDELLEYLRKWGWWSY